MATKVFGFRLNRDEERAIEGAARSLNMARTEWARHVLLLASRGRVNELVLLANTEYGGDRE